MLSAGAIQFSAAAFSVADSAGTVPIVMTRTGGSTGAVSIKLATSDGTAIAGTDYNALSGSVSFPDGATTEKLNLTVLPEPVANFPGRTVNLTLSSPSGGARSAAPARPCSPSPTSRHRAIWMEASEQMAGWMRW